MSASADRRFAKRPRSPYGAVVSSDARRAVAGRTRPQPARAAARHARSADPRRDRARGRRVSRRRSRRTGARSSATRRCCAGWACRSRPSRSATAPRSGTASAPSDYYLPDLGLTPEETAALRVAVSAVSLGNQAGEGALMKLGGVGDGAGGPIASLPIAPALATLFEAFRHRAVVTFRTAAGRGPSSRGACRRSAGTGTSSASTATATPCARSAPTASTATSRSATGRVRGARRLPPRRPRRGSAVAARRRPAGHRAPRASTPRTATRCSPSSAATRTIVDDDDGVDDGRARRHEPRRVPRVRARLPRARRGPRPARRARRHGRVARTRRGGAREPARRRRPRDPAHPRARPVDRRAPRRAEGRDRAAGSASPSTSSTTTSRSC